MLRDMRLSFTLLFSSNGLQCIPIQNSMPCYEHKVSLNHNYLNNLYISSSLDFYVVVYYFNMCGSMYCHPITQTHISSLRQLGWEVVSPVSKELACGDVGKINYTLHFSPHQSSVTTVL
jgi:hypothetical protein